ncbi:MAG: sialate O-acetylesterase [Clostridia bacterium]|nr:sialate O-acetylesterase [Clostridia bacterium]
MNSITDYAIIQRDKNGFGKCIFSGEYKYSGEIIMARVVSEDDNSTVIPWHRCSVGANEWKTELCVPEGGLYRAEARLCGAEQTETNNRYDWCDLIACVCHFGVGDIFVMAGQSNMSGYGRDPAYDPPELGIHLFDNSAKWCLAVHPLNSVPFPVYPNNDSSSGTSPALSFARALRRKLNVPIGLVAAAQGGSPLAAWNPAEEKPYLYEALVQKLNAVGQFRGMIWYQGCNEACDIQNAEAYLDKFTETVSLWREKFGYFPIATCQINRHAWKEEDREKMWGIVREAQRQAAKKIPDVYVIPTIDMYTSDGIHNASGACIVIGERLAAAMLKGHYRMGGYFAPDIKKITKTGSRTVLLEFEEKHMLRTMDDLACGMNIEDEHGMADCTSVCVLDSGAQVTCARDIGNNAVFHAYWHREQPAFFIRDIYGMPMLACYGVRIEEC